MKKILAFSLLVFSVFYLYQSVHADNAMDAIFKIQAYTYDKLSDTYVLKQYGSAVLIANNILLTNAHVITDDNNNLTLQYEACQTLSDQEAPKCFSTLQLLKYDKNADLALLQIVNPSNTMPDPVTIGSGTLTVGTNVHVIGYPANGGDTITTTQGTIAGFENNYYKTDANIDEGNSGGGTFDGAGNFVGIPTYVVNGQTTLGYIIPTDTIQKFIAGTLGTTYTQKYSSIFDKRLKSIYLIQDQGTITNTLFTTPTFSGINLELSTAIEKKNNNMYDYGMTNANGSTISMMSLIATDNTAISRYTNNTIKWFRDSNLSPTRSTKKISNTLFTTILFGNDKIIGYDYIQSNSTTKTYLEFVLFADKENAKDLSGFMGFVENTIIKKSYTQPQVFTIPSLKLSSKRNISIVKRIQDGGLHIGVFPSNGKYVSEITATTVDQGTTLKSIKKQFTDAYDALGSTATLETSKYPSTTAVISVTDENDKETLSVIGLKKYGSTNFYVTISINIIDSNAKQEAITMAYKILGLE